MTPMDESDNQDDHEHEHEQAEASGDDGRDSLPGDPLKALLRRSLTADEPPKGQVLRGVQRKIRQRSGGKFFADGWATGTRGSYALVALVMLVILVIAFVGLGPLSIQ